MLHTISEIKDPLSYNNTIWQIYNTQWRFANIHIDIVGPFHPLKDVFTYSLVSTDLLDGQKPFLFQTRQLILLPMPSLTVGYWQEFRNLYIDLDLVDLCRFSSFTVINIHYLCDYTIYNNIGDHWREFQYEWRRQNSIPSSKRRYMPWRFVTSYWDHLVRTHMTRSKSSLLK